MNELARSPFEGQGWFILTKQSKKGGSYPTATAFYLVFLQTDGSYGT
jgi:hypothetical protein